MEYESFEYTIRWKDDNGKEEIFPGATRDILDFNLIQRYFKVLTKKYPQRFMWIVAEPNFIGSQNKPIWGTETHKNWYEWIKELEKEATYGV
jgi:hypothetical protein